MPPGRARVAGLVLAAGGSRRFGVPKQLARLDGIPLLEHALLAMAEVRAIDPVVVTLGAHAEEICASVELHGARPVTVAAWREGQAASLRAGVAELPPDIDAVVVVLSDQPRIGAATIGRVLAAWDGIAPAVRAVHGGRPGHPVLLSRALFPAIAELRGDVGARELLRGGVVVEIACDEGAVLDVDTREQLERLRGRRG